jgi:hypothetical protein
MRSDRLQAVFSLTTTGTDIYAAMTRLAIASLRQSNPCLAVVVACDERSLAALKAAASPLLREADRWQAVEVPPGCATFRNRHVKTRLRELIDGKFLFLDSDLFIRGPHYWLFELDADVAAVPGASAPAPAAAASGRMPRSSPRSTGRSTAALHDGVSLFTTHLAGPLFARTWHLHGRQVAERLQRYVDQTGAQYRAAFDTSDCTCYQGYNHQVKCTTPSASPRRSALQLHQPQPGPHLLRVYALECSGRNARRHRIAAMAPACGKLLARDR